MRIALNDKAIHIGAILLINPSIAQKLPAQHHQFLLRFNSKELETLPDNNGCNHQIELFGPKQKLRMDLPYQLSQEEQKLLINYLNTMIKEGKIRRSNSTVGRPI